MDLNKEYAAHQQALMHAELARDDSDRRASLAQASVIAKRIGAFQQSLGAAAACAWSASQLHADART
ncbi:hypothetical protein OZN62_13225 [Aurantiacibacter sp. MUD11]|uniref:hypothetical protein n=1 Tax=Aurantiacibacter sp. MUD11 TaxID=3003265 RepID=UPI0022AAA36D|nr:hypothetical protein [Aurantiacibacter sp. MUD11]WAT17858.1 hypothetical protein OZN62_13225 [Aurantiacibacter sp. MUD11]